MNLINLDDRRQLDSLDSENMLAHIDGLPEQFEKAWNVGLGQELPESLQSIRQVVICGMGGSAIGGDLLAGLMNAQGSVSVLVNRGYDLPYWARQDDTLVIASSFSGNTEETIAGYEDTVERGLPALAITTGGKLAQMAHSNPGHILWQFDHKAQPRAAIGWSLGMLLALAHRLDWLPNLETDVAATVNAMKAHRTTYGFDTPAATNPAKRQAGQFMERMPVIFGSGAFEIVARRWKTQLNENSKIWAMYEPMPEANHNNVVGIEYPDFLLSKLVTVFIRSERFDHPRVKLRYDLTAQLYLENGIGIDTFNAEGSCMLSQMMHAIQFGDYVSFYAAIAQGADPTAIAPINWLKQQMAERN